MQAPAPTKLDAELMKPTDGGNQPSCMMEREETDAESRRVPQMKTPPRPPTPTPTATSSGEEEPAAPATQSTSSSQQPRKRGGGTAADKEHKRLKRLLRNRVSAQQARERKKVYMSDLEVRSRDLEQRNAELEEKLSTLQRENFMLRQVSLLPWLVAGSTGTLGGPTEPQCFAGPQWGGSLGGRGTDWATAGRCGPGPGAQSLTAHWRRAQRISAALAGRL